jgi:hypothetical protein
MSFMTEVAADTESDCSSLDVLLPDRWALGVNDVRRTEPCFGVDTGNCNVEPAAGAAVVAVAATELESTGAGMHTVAGGDDGDTLLLDDAAPIPIAACVSSTAQP